LLAVGERACGQVESRGRVCLLLRGDGVTESEKTCLKGTTKDDMEAKGENTFRIHQKRRWVMNDWRKTKIKGNKRRRSAQKTRDARRSLYQHVGLGGELIYTAYGVDEVRTTNRNSD